MNVIKQEGVLSLNHGLTAAVLRQLTYSTTRFAVYEVSVLSLMPLAITRVYPIGGWIQCTVIPVVYIYDQWLSTVCLVN
jgi:hypothetical protein